jgi:hypothetical protein
VITLAQLYFDVFLSSLYRQVEGDVKQKQGKYCQKLCQQITSEFSFPLGLNPLSKVAASLSIGQSLNLSEGEEAKQIPNKTVFILRSQRLDFFLFLLKTTEVYAFKSFQIIPRGWQ